VRRLELKRIRLCSKCGRGRAELVGGDGERIEVPLDAPRAQALAGEQDEVASLSTLVLGQAALAGTTFDEIVFDRGMSGLRALLSFTRAGAHDVVACTAQEGVELAVRGSIAMYATDEALTREADAPRTTVH
jgi:hypothetical protein